MSARVSYKKQILFGIMLILIGLTVIEVLSRISVYNDPPCLFMNSEIYGIHGYEYKREVCHDNINYVWSVYPELSIKADQHFKTININNDGFRGPEISKEKLENAYRIFVIGGSTAFAGSSDETTVAGYLQNEFNKKNSELKVEVINAGIINAFSFTETKYVKEKLVNYDPDMIIVYTGINDLLKPFDIHNMVWAESKTKEQIANIVRQNYAVWNTPVVIRYMLDVKIPNEINKNKIMPFDDSKMDEKVTLWEERWSEICTLGNDKGFQTIIVLQPMLGTSNRTLTEHEQQLFNQLDKNRYFTSYQKYADGLENLNEHCSDTADFRQIFDEIVEPLYYDKYHVGDEGNLIIAEGLYDFVFSKINMSLG